METSLLSAKQLHQINGRDCISELHETVICRILSRLPLKDAVRTSILSKKWEYRWISLYNVDIGVLEQLSDSEQMSKNERFVTILEKLHFSQDLKSFSLVNPPSHYNRILVTLISGALRCNIESLELETTTFDPKGFVLPRSLINNASLTKLKLRSSCIFKVPVDNCFPNLTCLQLKFVEILNKVCNSDRLVFSFPVLKTFELMYCKWSNVNLVEIYSPRLSTFMCATRWSSDEPSGYSIKICGARLEKFGSLGGFPENIIFYDSVVLNATLYCNWTNPLLSGIQVLKLLDGFSSTITDLELSRCVYEAIAVSKHEVLLPQFSMLRRLSIDVYRNADVLIELLHSAPSLKYLQIACTDPREYNSAGLDSVPDCVVSHLQEVSFVHNAHRPSYHKPVIHLAKFFQKHGVELKNIYVHDTLLKFLSS